MDKKLYTCPMDPDVISESPGNCPKCGMKLVEMNHDHRHHEGMEEDFQKRFLITLPLVILAIAMNFFSFSGKDLVYFFIGTFIFFYGGWPFFQGAKGEFWAKNPGMMTLVAFAITAGYLFSVAATFIFAAQSFFWEISTLISAFLLGHWLEMRAIRGTTGALAELAKLIPPSSHMITGKEIMDVATESLKVNDIILVKPGEKVPIDGVVVDGESSVNESMITGESRPVPKKINDKVTGGTLNQDGSLTVKVSKIGADTAISQIQKLIKDAQSTKPNVQHLADRAASVLFFVAIGAGLISFIYWFSISPSGIVFAATLAVSAIVVACPHALGLAIPTVTTISTMLGAKNGILIKDMKGLEIARKINYAVFDKTGTLTKGEFGIVNDVDSRVLALAAAVESYSQHSIAKGIVNEAKKRNLVLSKVEGFKSFPGKGAEGIVDKQKIIVGNAALLNVKNLEVTDKTVVYVSINGKLAGTILLEDLIRDESAETIDRLHQMGIKTAMLTGDTDDVAKEVGEKLKIDTVFSKVLPEDKVNKVKELQDKGNIVAMVGDGVNDAPSLTQAHLGIAIGAGTDVAIESAQIVLMKNNPLDVVKAISLSRQTNSKMLQNLIWATGYNVLAIPVAAGALYNQFGILLKPEWAAILMSASSIIVVFNALRLRKAKL